MRLAVFALASLAVTTPAFAEDHGRDGFRLETHASLETATFKGAPTGGQSAALGSGLAMGAEAGYDFTYGKRIVAGPYVAYDRSSVEMCDAGGCIAVRDNFAAGVQLAYLKGESQVLYVKAGYARLTLDADVGGQASSGMGDGWQVVSGWEFPLIRDFYARVEGGYADNGRIYNVDFQRLHSTVAVGMRF